MKCSYCGAECQEGAVFCGSCGKKLVVSAETTGNATESNSTASSAGDNPSGGSTGSGSTAKKPMQFDTSQWNSNNKRNGRGNRGGGGGVFAKDFQTCKKCGKQFSALLSKDYCPECEQAMANKRYQVAGYLDMPRYGWGYSDDESFYNQIIEHRNGILEKYKPVNGIKDKDILIDKIRDYQNLSITEAEDVMSSILSSCLVESGPDLVSDYFYAPGRYPGSVVELTDVFAAGYAHAAHDKNYDNVETLILVCFTNDKYMPVFHTYFDALHSLLRMRSKGGRNELEAYCAKVFPNLTYPVMDLKKLKRQVKSDGSVKGNLSANFMIDQIDDATSNSGVYKLRKLGQSYIEWDVFEKYGFINWDEIEPWLLKNRKARKYWDGVLDSLTNHITSSLVDSDG